MRRFLACFCMFCVGGRYIIGNPLQFDICGLIYWRQYTQKVKQLDFRFPFVSSRRRPEMAEMIFATSFPGSSLFLPRESTLVSAGRVAPKIWVLTRMCYRGGVAKCKIVTSIRMVESTGGDVSFFRNICGDKNSFYRQVFLHTYERSTSKRSMLFSTQKITFTSLWISKHCR